MAISAIYAKYIAGVLGGTFTPQRFRVTLYEGNL
jgi:hypothetical protein